jgi:hypothetical protein
LYAAANSLIILNSVVAKLNGTGLSFSANATGGIYNSTLTQNIGDGMVVNLNSHAKLISCTVTGNSNGVTVYGESSIYLVGTKVSSNKQRGLNITSHAHASLWGGNTISNNGPTPIQSWLGGICIYNGSQVSIVPSSFTSVKDLISYNKGPGIYVGEKSELLVTYGTVTKNQLDGVRLAHDSSAQFDTGASITYNNGFGIRGTDAAGDSKYAGTPGSLVGNVLGEASCPKFNP